MAVYTYYNGQFGDAESMTVPLLNRALYFGDGCYDASFTNEGSITDCDDHIDRFFNSMKGLRIEPDFTKSELKALLMETLDRSGEKYSLLYWQCDRGTARRSHAFPKDTKPDLLISVNPKPGFPDVYRPGSGITFEDRRFTYCNIKTLNLLPNVLANQAAAEAGVTEAIFVRPDGYVTEGSHTNVSIIKDGKLITHENGSLILPGITKKHVLILAQQLGYEVIEKAFTREEMMAADEVFSTGSGTFTLRYSKIDGVPVGMKDEKAYNEIAGAYMKHVKDQTGRQEVRCDESDN